MTYVAIIEGMDEDDRADFERSLLPPERRKKVERGSKIAAILAAGGELA
jgi:hypothetical protein